MPCPAKPPLSLFRLWLCSPSGSKANDLMLPVANGVVDLSNALQQHSCLKRLYNLPRREREREIGWERGFVGLQLLVWANGRDSKHARGRLARRERRQAGPLGKRACLTSCSSSTIRGTLPGSGSSACSRGARLPGSSAAAGMMLLCPRTPSISPSSKRALAIDGLQAPSRKPLRRRRTAPMAPAVLPRSRRPWRALAGMGCDA